MNTAMRLAIMIHEALMAERTGCAVVARAGGFEAAALAIEGQPAPVPSLRDIHCEYCAATVKCAACGMDAVIGKCPGIAP